jgi:hypothetical protein
VWLAPNADWCEALVLTTVHSRTCQRSVVTSGPVALGPGVYSASNRNEYQKHKNNVSGE